MDNGNPVYGKFLWEDLGNLQTGRPNLGLKVSVLAYRLFEYSLRHVLSMECGEDRANDLLRKAGRLAGLQFCQNLLKMDVGFNSFAAQLQKSLMEQGIGILRIEKADLDKMTFTLTVAEDVDCSGLPNVDEVICQYDEGFIAGLLEAYTGKVFDAKETDCWASGDKVCRFDVKLSGEN